MTPIMFPLSYFSRLRIAHYKPLFWIFFAGVSILAYIQSQQSKLLTNETAKHGIVSLETGWSYSRDTAILASWEKTLIKNPFVDSSGISRSHNLLKNARININTDFVFIFFYTGFALFLILWLRSFSSVKITNGLMWLALLAGALDVLENIGMLSLVDQRTTIPLSMGSHWLAPLVSLSAYLKFILLTGLIAIHLPAILRRHPLKRFSALLEYRMRQLLRYRVILIGITIFSLVIWLLDQGQDLLVNINSANSGVIVFLLTLTIAALINWYLCKLFFGRADKEPCYPFREPLPQTYLLGEEEKKVSRFLGVATILLPAGGILYALTKTKVPYILSFFSPGTWLIISLAIYYFLIKYDTAKRIYDWFKSRHSESTAKLIFGSLIIVLSLLLPLVVYIFRREEIHQPDSLIYLYMDLVLLALAFYIFVSLRTYLFAQSLFGSKIGLLVFILSLIASIIFIGFNIDPLFVLFPGNQFMTLPLFMSGIIFYIFAITLVMRLSQRLHINFMLLLIIGAFIISIRNVNNYHQANLQSFQPHSAKENLTDYFRAWVLKRKDEIRPGAEYPVFLVNTYGGGIRAAAFLSMTISFLDSAFLAGGQGKQAFEHYAFSVSGASGGTIGAAIQCANRYTYLDNPLYYKSQRLINFYQNDFLSPVLVPDLGRDVLSSATGTMYWKDRAWFHEAVFANYAKDSLGLQLGLGYDSIWSAENSKLRSYEVPLLFSNTLNVDDGLKGICAPVKLNPDDFPATIFIDDRLDTMNRKLHSPDSLGLSLITGAFLSARFPFISPGAKLGAGFHFIDGGGKDNSGASTSELIFATIARYSDSCRKICDKSPADSEFCALLSSLHFYFVSVNNSPRKDDDRRLVENRLEIISPVVGIVNSGINGNAHAADSTLLSRYGRDTTNMHLGFFTRYFPIFPSNSFIRNKKGIKFAPVLPLGWQISQTALQSLQNTFDTSNLDKDETLGLREILRRRL